MKKIDKIHKSNNKSSEEFYQKEMQQKEINQKDMNKENASTYNDLNDNALNDNALSNSDLNNNSEFSFINNLKENVQGQLIGDDAALYENILICKDVISENVHFLPSTPIELVISKLFTSNISDIAAMGGISSSCLIGLSLEKNRFEGFKIINSIKSEKERYNVEIIGGDTTSAKNSNFLSLTAIGKRNEFVIYRNGAKAGDSIYISRYTGLCRKSLELELNNINTVEIISDDLLLNYGLNKEYKTYKSNEKIKLDKYFHYKVKAETEIGEILGRRSEVTSCTDISDGLLLDLNSILNSSNVSAILNLSEIEIPNIIGRDNTEKFEYFFNSGEEYALIFTVDKENEESIIEEIRSKTGRNIIKIGKIIENLNNNSKIFNEFNEEINNDSFSLKCYEHFK